MSDTLQILKKANNRRYGMLTKGVLTSEEAYQSSLVNDKRILSISSDTHKVFFFTDNYTFAYHDLPDHFIRSSVNFPIKIDLNTEIIDTVDKFISHFHKNQKQINSTEELAFFLDSKIERKQNV